MKSLGRSARSRDAGTALRVVLPIVVLLACLGVVGYFASKALRPSQRQPKPKEFARVDAEWIPGAAMRSVVPGRFEFEAGNRDLVVISRVTERNPRSSGSIDRLWLQLPADLPVGQPLDLVTLQANSDLGFDQGVYRDGVFAAIPEMRGSVTLRQRTDDWLMLELKGGLVPPAGPAWALDDFVVAYREPEGLHAHRSDGTGTAQDVAARAMPAPAADLVGQWFGELTDAQGRSMFDVYYQFNTDGRFAHSTCRGGGGGKGYSPGMKYGRWRLHGDRLTMIVDVFVFDEPKDNDHLDHLQNRPVLVLRVEPIATGITFTGNLRAPGGDALKLPRLKRVSVPYLFTHRPNFDRQPGFYERPMPAPDEVVPRGVSKP